MAAASQPVLQKYDLLGRSVADLRAWMAAHGEPAYRGAQLYHALYSEGRFDFAEMTNLPASLRARLAAEARVGMPAIARRYLSADGAVRYLLALPGDEAPARERVVELPAVAPQERSARIEAVFMPSEGRQTICISTQAGCAVDCHFCLTARLGLIRNLTAGEIVGQVLLARADYSKNVGALAPRTNVVLMGQGEPLLNYEPTLEAVRIMLDPNGMALAARHVTLSTSGIVPGIDRLAQEKVRPKMAISLNASTNQQRDALMPINRKYPLEQLMDACRRYPLRPWEHLTFEYVLLGGVNDAPEDARRVARLLAGPPGATPLNAKVNLIPWNPGELPFHSPLAERVEEFRRVLSERDVPVFVRQSRGRDIAAACGQLALIESAAASAAPSPPPA